jgi:hypothetical protein
MYPFTILGQDSEERKRGEGRGEIEEGGQREKGMGRGDREAG